MPASQKFSHLQLPPAEWDFREVPDDERYFASIYEFARESPTRDKIISWQSQPFAKLVEHFPENSLARYYRRRCRGTVREALAYGNSLPPLSDFRNRPPLEYPSQFSFFTGVEVGAAVSFAKPIFATIAARADRFPEPWTSIRNSSGGIVLRENWKLPPRRSPAVSEIPLKIDVESAFAEEEKADVVELHLWVNLNRSREELKTDFIRILDDLGIASGSGGRKSKDVFLKSLAAYRLKKSGVEWDAVKELVRTGSQDLGRVPIFSSKQLWNNAIRSAENWLSGDYVIAIEEEFR